MKAGRQNGIWVGAVLALSITASFVGCGKKQPAQPASPPPTPAAEAPATPAPPAPAAAASSVSASPATTTRATDSYDTVVTARSIEYLQGQVARKNWPQARLALKQLEGRPLTAEQRQYVDGLKARIPPG